jgi:hypothetical protein
LKPNIHPNPKDISVQETIVDTLLGKSFIRIDRTAPIAAASATPLINLQVGKVPVKPFKLIKQAM